MAEIVIEKEALDSALATVARELTEMLKTEAVALNKAAKDDAPSEASEGSEGPSEPEESSAPADGAEASAPPAEGSAPPAPPAEASASPDASAAAAAPEGSPQHEGGEIEPAPTVEGLQAEYAKLDPEALKMHYLACKSALMAVMGAEQSAPGGAPPGAEASAAAPPPASPSPPPGAAPMAMGEMSGKQVQLGDKKGNGGAIEAGKMSKSEEAKDAEIVALRKAQAVQEEAVAGLAKVVEKMLQPVRKSVKGVSDLKFVPRTEEAKPAPAANLTKKEVVAKLRDKVREGKLSKADKELVSSYTVGNIDVSKIEHLLVSAAK